MKLIGKYMQKKSFIKNFIVNIQNNCGFYSLGLYNH